MSPERAHSVNDQSDSLPQPLAGDALVRLPNSPVDGSVGIGLYILDDGSGFYEQLLAKLIGLTFEVIDSILSLPQLS